MNLKDYIFLFLIFLALVLPFSMGEIQVFSNSVVATLNADLNGFLNQAKFDGNFQIAFDSNMNRFLRQDHNWSGINDFNNPDGLKSNDLNVFDDINLGGILTFQNATANGILTYSGLTFTLNDDLIPNTNNTFNLGSSTQIWANLYTRNMRCEGGCSLNTESSADNNISAINSNATGKANFVVSDGNFYTTNPGNIYSDGNITTDENLNSPRICISDDCKTAWPSGGSTTDTTLDSNNQADNSYLSKNHNWSGINDFNIGSGIKVSGINIDNNSGNIDSNSQGLTFRDSANPNGATLTDLLRDINGGGTTFVGDGNVYSLGILDANNQVLIDWNFSKSTPSISSTTQLDFGVLAPGSNCFRIRWNGAGNLADENNIMIRPLGSAACRPKTLMIGSNNISMDLNVTGKLFLQFPTDQNKNYLDSNAGGLTFFDTQFPFGITLSNILNNRTTVDFIDLNGYLNQSKFDSNFQKAFDSNFTNSFDSNINKILTLNNNWSGSNDFNKLNGTKINDLNVYHDLNLGGKLTFENPTAKGIMTYSGLVFTVNDDWNPTTNNTLDLGSATNRWNELYSPNLNCVGQCSISNGTAADNNTRIDNLAAGKGNLTVPDGNAYFHKNVYVENNFYDWNYSYFDKNITVKDQNVFIINGKTNIGGIITAGTTGDTFAANASIPAGATFTCLYVLDTAGIPQACNSALIVGTVWAKVT